jgi:hypothetical protein
MSTTWTIEVPVHFHRTGHGSRKELHSGAQAPALPPGRVPRVSRLMALAQAFQGSRFHLLACCLTALRAWRIRKVETWGHRLL